MAGLGSNLKMALLKTMEAVGKGASSMASSAQQKLGEINLETRRREILSELPMRAFDLWQKGVPLPDPLGGMMEELVRLDEHLSVLRAQRYAKIEEASEQGVDEPATAQPLPDRPQSDDVTDSGDSVLTQAPVACAAVQDDKASAQPCEGQPADIEATSDHFFDEGETGDNA